MNFLNYSQDYYRLRQFYFVAKAGSLSAAGRMMNLTHCTLSESMKILEHRLKSKLLVREGRGMKLTVDGERLFEYVEKMYNESEAFLQGFQEKEDDLLGEIRLMTTPLMGETILTHMLLPFLEKHPKLKVTILTKLDDFDVREVDIAIKTFIPKRLDLEQKLLKTFHMKLYASQDYLDKFGIPNTVKDLDQHRLLAIETDKNFIYYDANWMNWLLYVGNETKQPRQAFYKITSNEGLHNAALQNYGIVQLTKEYIALKKSKLKEVLPDLEEPTVDMYFICTKEKAKIKRIKALYEFLKEQVN